MRLLIIVLLVFGIVDKIYCHRYRDEWSDLDKRPIPEWYDRAKIGILIHWGLYSVPALKFPSDGKTAEVGSEWFWYQYMKFGKEKKNDPILKQFPPGFTYQDFASQFRAEHFDPDSWADLFARSGAKYVVLTSKHHDGFSLFPSNHSFCWNSVDVGPHRDLVGAVASAVRAQGMQFGVYYSLGEWFHPYFKEDEANSFLTYKYRDMKVIPELKQLVQTYRPSIIWADGDWASTCYFDSSGFLAWLYNDSPVREYVVVNDRWGHHSRCKHGGVFSCDGRSDNSHAHKWELPIRMDRTSWGSRRDMYLLDVLTVEEMLEQLISTVSAGGNLLINIGPSKEGTIDALFQERLVMLGAWLQVNGEAVYESSPWYSQRDNSTDNVWYTCTKYNGSPANPDNVTAVYALFWRWPTTNLLLIKDILPFIGRNTRIQMLGEEGFLKPIKMIRLCEGRLVKVDYMVKCMGRVSEKPEDTVTTIKINGTKNNSSYAFNFHFAGQHFTDIDSPEREVLMVNGIINSGSVVMDRLLGVHLPSQSQVKSKHAWVLKFYNQTDFDNDLIMF